MRMFVIGAACLALAACAQQAPVSNPPQGVGFGEPGESAAVRAERARQLQTGPATADGAITLDELSALGIGAQPSRAGAEMQTAAAPGAPLNATGAADGMPPGFPPRAVDPALAAGRIGGLEASPTNAAPVLVGNTGLSNEQDFDAVSAQRTIESDAERQARLAASYQVVTPGALPDRAAGDAGPNIVAYALQTTNAVGQQVHRRFAPNANRAARTCALYPSAEAAQRDFLAQGGPERDRLGIDPDGDGFACRWDPAPFRALRGG
ncbi:hypothetical protein [Histidinibacterium lentulum]|uniref:Excalibur calcium-binding domain-containing protein n=1 Tax=Histidinibacterium lentulum TaxID=2480588 RepID=A0A3N2R8Z9_9RHOB|nr:hypothetical protein [Histidinibacterium lentulum]ROU03816.1 hypothetical protein EAT49_03895 [Histidinibacterium lentulum]